MMANMTIANVTLTTLANWKTKIGSTIANIFLQCEGNAANLGPSDTTYGNAANQVDSNWPLWPIAIASATSGVTGRHGTMTDMWFGSSARSSGDRYPAGGSAQFAQFQSFVVPWNGGAVNLT
jgi:hypothetical protein